MARVDVVECEICLTEELFEIVDERFTVTSHVCADCARALGPEWVRRRASAGALPEAPDGD